MHYSPRTGETYVHWIKRFILFHDKRHPKEMGAAEVQAFLTYLAIDQNVAASTQNQAPSALLFLYRHVLHQPLDLKVDAKVKLVHERDLAKGFGSAPLPLP